MVVKDDWFFRQMSDPTNEAVMESVARFFDTWRTDIRKVSKGL